MADSEARLEAVLSHMPPEKSPSAPRRCFICLTDESPSDPPSSWVDPCPCTLEAHQDCMLSWVTDCERSNKPLQCPVCKSDIALEGPWDPIVALSEGLQRRFTRASPYMLFTGASLGVQFSAQLYGALAMWVFAGREPLRDYILGPRMFLDHQAPFRNKLARVGNVTMLMNVAPVLLFSHMLPSLSNKIFVTSASVYGIYQLMHDENFLLLPPSPQLVFTILPGIRSLYYNLYREFVWPYEVDLNRQIIGLPPVESRQNGPADRDNRRNADRIGEGGVIGFLQNVLDALEPDDGEQGGADARQPLVQGEAAMEGANVEAELVFEVVIDDGGEARNGHGAEDAGEEPQVNGQLPAAGQDADGAQDDGDGEHEAPQAPPVRRAGIGAILSNVSNSIVSALILPAISAAMGEALRLMLPKSWTAPIGLRRAGMLRQQWGRSLIGGCLFVVIKDAVRIYTKSRKVAAMSNRRVKNVDRRRKNS